jgi:cytoplasmic iron level regulating protein YaaA (DUF328/UPF0246 family)
MLLLLSPAKTLNEKPSLPPLPPTQPAFLSEALQLIEQLKPLKPKDLRTLMDVSDALATLNAERFAHFAVPHTPDNAHAALTLFRGDVYVPIKAADYTSDQWRYAQAHVLMLSGLYGLLRPLDLIQPYRLEMGTALANPRGKNLYHFWDRKIADALQEVFPSVIVNLASEEYFSAVQREHLSMPIVDIFFKEHRKGELKNIGIFAKKARGMMTHYAITHQIDRAEGLKEFAEEGYGFRKDLSSDKAWVFVR